MRIAVGGPSRGAGKTAVICGIIAALKDAGWTCVKVTPHEHGGCKLVEETDPAATHDTSRYLAAGARRAYLLRADDTAEAASALRQVLEAARNAIVESARMAGGIQPDLRMAVVDPDSNWKPGAAEFVERADVVVVVGDGEYTERAGQCVYRVAAPEYRSAKLIEAIQRQLASR